MIDSMVLLPLHFHYRQLGTLIFLYSKSVLFTDEIGVMWFPATLCPNWFQTERQRSPLTLLVSRRCTSRRRSSASAASCPGPASARSTCTATAPSSSPAPWSCPCWLPRLWSPAGSSRRLPAALCSPQIASPPPPPPPAAAAGGGGGSAEFALDRQELSSPPAARSDGWGAAERRSAPGTHQPDSPSYHSFMSDLSTRGKKLSQMCAWCTNLEGNALKAVIKAFWRSVNHKSSAEGERVTAPCGLRDEGLKFACGPDIVAFEGRNQMQAISLDGSWFRFLGSWGREGAFIWNPPPFLLFLLLTRNAPKLGALLSSTNADGCYP